MPWFEYEGLTPGSTPIRGRVEAKDHEQAAAELAEMRIDVRDLSVAPEAPARPLKISADDLIGFNEHLASLSKAGIALDEGLAATGQRRRVTIHAPLDRVASGRHSSRHSVGRSLRRPRKQSPRSYTAMCSVQG